MIQDTEKTFYYITSSLLLKQLFVVHEEVNEFGERNKKESKHIVIF